MTTIPIQRFFEAAGVGEGDDEVEAYRRDLTAACRKAWHRQHEMRSVIGTWTWHKEVGGKSAGEIGGWRKSDWVIDKAKNPKNPKNPLAQLRLFFFLPTRLGTRRWRLWLPATSDPSRNLALISDLKNVRRISFRAQKWLCCRSARLARTRLARLLVTRFRRLVTILLARWHLVLTETLARGRGSPSRPPGRYLSRIGSAPQSVLFSYLRIRLWPKPVSAIANTRRICSSGNAVCAG